MDNALFSPFTQRGVTFPNRLVMSPMCQYSASDGIPGLWHWLHLGARAVGGVGLVMVESTAVSPEARITPWDLGLWNVEQERAFTHLVESLHIMGVKVGVQLSHAGRKGSTDVPWRGDGYLDATGGGWTVMAPSARPYSEDSPIPQEATTEDIQGVVEQFCESSRRAARIGFDVVEIHAAHGYLIHQFLSPLSNARQDEYGGGLHNRLRLLHEVAAGVRMAWPDDRPLWIRLPMTDWHVEGWQFSDALEAARNLKSLGVDLIDCSSGRIRAAVTPQGGPIYHGPFARKIRDEVSIATGVVGNINTLAEAESVIMQRMGDVVILGRRLLEDPYLPLRWGAESRQMMWPVQYLRALNRGANGRDIRALWDVEVRMAPHRPESDR